VDFEFLTPLHLAALHGDGQLDVLIGQLGAMMGPWSHHWSIGCLIAQLGGRMGVMTVGQLGHDSRPQAETSRANPCWRRELTLRLRRLKASPRSSQPHMLGKTGEQ
jgi:hypothetical protein